MGSNLRKMWIQRLAHSYVQRASSLDGRVPHLGVGE